MSTYLSETQQALEIQAVAVLNAAPISMPSGEIAVPNVVFKPTPGTPFARLDHLPGKTSPASTGVGGLTHRPGVLQVSLFYPQGKGTKDIVAAAQAVCDGFKRGTALTRGGTSVKIESASPGPFLDEDGWVQLPVSIAWRVHAVD